MKFDLYIEGDGPSELTASSPGEALLKVERMMSLRPGAGLHSIVARVSEDTKRQMADVFSAAGFEQEQYQYMPYGEWVFYQPMKTGADGFEERLVVQVWVEEVFDGDIYHGQSHTEVNYGISHWPQRPDRDLFQRYVRTESSTELSEWLAKFKLDR